MINCEHQHLLVKCLGSSLLFEIFQYGILFREASLLLFFLARGRTFNTRPWSYSFFSWLKELMVILLHNTITHILILLKVLKVVFPALHPFFGTLF